MPDIEMCAQNECPKAKECYRFRAIPTEYWQAYGAPEFDENGCKYFWKIEPGSKVREINER